MNNENITALLGQILGETFATGQATKSESYSVSLKLGKIQSSIVKLQKDTAGGWEDVSEGGDLLQIKDDLLFLDKLRIIIEDNTGLNLTSRSSGLGLASRRSSLYEGNRRSLSGILNFSIPLKLEIRKFHGDKQLPVKRSDNIRAVITVIDPKEDVNQVKGVFSGIVKILSPKNSGKDFITLFNNEV
ncbi:MAG: hypothetical protein QXR05_11865, partial [Candidatus Methanomethylicia archaeon]